MAFSAEEEKAIRELAEMEGRSVEDVKREMLRAKLGLSGSPAREQVSVSLSRRSPGSGDASGASLARTRTEAVQAHHSQEFSGSPVVRYDGDPYSETPEQAAERWLEEEAELADGVHGIGGQSAGGIFGGGAIATSIYDPEAMGRGDARVGQMASVKMLGLVERLTQRLDESEARAAQLSGGTRGALPGAATRRLGRGKPR